MLRIVYHSSPADKTAYFQTVKSSEEMWLVSHLEAKKCIQGEFLKEKNILSSRAVQRASEYWAWLFSVNCPEWNLVSESLIFTWMEEWFSTEDIEPRYRDIALFYNFFEQFLPVFSGDQKELFYEWLASDPFREERLAGWLEQGEKFWAFLNVKKSLPRPWILSVLLRKENINYGPTKKFYVDLGTDIQQQELEFIIQMSRTCDVDVLIPQSEWSGEYGSIFSVYKKLQDLMPSATTLPPENTSKPRLGVAVHPSVVSEVKGVVAQVREWLEQGVPAANIAVVSPTIEDYWDLLREHFIVEGVPLNKKLVAKPISFPYVQSWLARLHLRQKEIQQAHVESFLFDEYGKTPDAALSYRDFKKHYSFLYEDAEARRRLNIPGTQKEASLTLLQFIEIMDREWPVDNRMLIDGWADQFIQDVGPQTSFHYDLWLKYLELILSRDEVPVVGADEKGLWVGNVSHADWPSLTHALVLGCTQKNLREQLQTPALAADIFAIENDLGLVLNRAEQTKKEFDLRWFLEKPLELAYLSRSQTDFEGQPQTASSFLLGLEKDHRVQLPELSRWDQVMRSSLEQTARELEWEAAESSVLQQKLNLEVNLGGYKNITGVRDLSLSASGLTKYHDCAFSFYASKVLRLEEPRRYDLDIDPMYQGLLFHAILEEIGKRGDRLPENFDEFSEIYDMALKTLSLEAPTHSFWLNEKERHYQFVMNFLDMEKEWRRMFPQTRIHGTETPFEGYMGVVDGELHLSKDRQHESHYLVRGKIDRIDRDVHGHIAVTDYKTSEGKLQGVDNWVKNAQFQMPLYAMAVERGLAEGIEPAKVMAAFYMMLKEKERGKGFVLTDHEHELGDTSNKRLKQNMDLQKREEIFRDISKLMMECLEKISAGAFPAIPKDVKICKTCNWSMVCRAPHLR